MRQAAMATRCLPTTSSSKKKALSMPKSMRMRVVFERPMLGEDTRARRVEAKESELAVRVQR